MNECRHVIVTGGGTEISCSPDECPNCLNKQIAALLAENESLKDKVDVLDQCLAEESAYSPEELRMDAEIAALRAELHAEKNKAPLDTNCHRRITRERARG